MELPEFLRARLDEMEARVVDHEGHTVRAYLLADVAAKRRIVELHEGAHECPSYDHHGDVDDFTVIPDGSDCATQRLLAAPHAGHPDFDPAWKVD